MPLFYIVIVAVTSASFKSPTFSLALNIAAFVVATLELLLLLGARIHGA